MAKFKDLNFLVILRGIIPLKMRLGYGWFQGLDFLFWNADDHVVTEKNITYNSNFNVKKFEATINQQATSFDPSTNVVLTDTSRAVAVNRCDKTSCDLVSCTETNTCTLLYIPHHCEVRNKLGSAVYKSSENEESCSAPPPS
ncbi:hypothetical protein LOTGIDRAFT_161646 [Lottia gigantea]|uniref:Uncharacterized protein n=1 Tax=Lottia gigantea TaxID=225164 RepID=V4A9V9_LOTGI|nr:hypothetical protein LOTGIDRAFT_161646 [Lottia gigantea]ESO93542.1 hypothetical protein LOTGIDRAFT_161646 [Lottia gigantea]